jgi:hypothetical protein
MARGVTKVKKKTKSIAIYVCICNSIIDELLAEPLPPPLHIV